MTRRPVRSRGRPRRFALMLIAGLLISSGLLRLGLGLDRAWAMVAAPSPPPSAKHCAPTAAPRTGFMPVVAALKLREQRVATKEKALQDRARVVASAEKAVDVKLADLKAAEDRLARHLTLARTAAAGDVAKLTAMYENMKPKMAAALFQKMAPDFAAGFLARMKPQAAALILSGLTPDKAYTISVMLAGRNAAAPRK